MEQDGWEWLEWQFYHEYCSECRSECDGTSYTHKDTCSKKQGIKISTQPESVSANLGDDVTFEVTAIGTGLTYQWQYNGTSSNGEWKNTTLASADTNKLSMIATVARNGYKYRCLITDYAGNKVYSDVVTLSVFGIQSQPTSVTANIGDALSFKVEAIGNGLIYQWQYRSSASGNWSNTTLTGAKTDTLKVTATAARNGYQYRCKVTDASGNVVYSNAATLTARAALAITTQPSSVTANIGNTATFKVVASGSGLKYQWQWRANSSSAWAATTVTGNKTATISVPVTAARNGYQYRCKITDSKGNVLYSNAATLTVKSGPVINTQPASVTANVGATATFKVVATGTGLTYQWQWRANSSSTWASTTVSGNRTAAISVPATAARNGYQYRCKITDVNNNVVYSNAVTLTVKAALAITTQPKSVTANVGETATFKVVATGTGLTYQWQWRKNASSTWASTTVSGNKTATITVPATAARNGYQYRCKITDANGKIVYSNAATLTVKSGPVINTQPKSQTANVGETATFKVVATGTGLTYQWQWRKNASSTWAATTVSGNKTAAIKVPATAARNGYQYRCKITDSNGNVIYSSAATLTVK